MRPYTDETVKVFWPVIGAFYAQEVDSWQRISENNFQAGMHFRDGDMAPVGKMEGESVRLV